MDSSMTAVKDNSNSSEFIQIKFQAGPVHQVGINGCMLEDVIELLIAKLDSYQLGKLPCEENELAIKHLDVARKALMYRRKSRRDQGVLDTHQPHKSLFDHRTEDVDAEFSATGA